MSSNPAFPNSVPLDFQYAHDGMSERRYIATKAMQGWLASYGPDESVKISTLVQFAYAIADAMIEYDE